MTFDDCFAALIGNEGVLSMDPNDRGNWTGGRIGAGELRGSKYGISAGAHPTLDIKSLTLDDARNIYAAEYWRPAGCHLVPEELRFDLFDFAVNSGPGRAARTLQKAVGASEDGVIGPRTVMAIGAYPPLLVLRRLNAYRQLLMTDDPAWSTQGRGWMKRLANNALRAA